MGHRLRRFPRSHYFWIAIHVVLLLLFLFLSWKYYEGPSPGALEYHKALDILGGQIPYHDFTFEYPPLVILLWVIPALFFRSMPFYFIAFAIEIFFFDFLAMKLIIHLSRRLNLSMVRSLFFYTLFIGVVAGPIVIQRCDLVPAVLMLAALVALIKGRNSLAWSMLALGVVAKLFPIIIAPLFVIWYLIKKQYKQLIKGVAVFVAVILVTVIPWIIIDAQGFWYSINYHLQRGLHAESSYGSFLLLAQLLGFIRVGGGFSFGSYNLISPTADYITGVSFYIALEILLILYLLFALKLSGLQRGQKNNISTVMPNVEMESLLLRYALLVIIGLMISSKIFSPQYMVWFCPLLPLINIRGSNLIFILCLIAGGATLYIYPFNYTPFARFETFPVIMMALRNLLLIVIGFLVLFPRRYKVRT